MRRIRILFHASSAAILGETVCTWFVITSCTRIVDLLRPIPDITTRKHRPDQLASVPDMSCRNQPLFMQMNIVRRNPQPPEIPLALAREISPIRRDGHGRPLAQIGIGVPL